MSSNRDSLSNNSNSTQHHLPLFSPQRTCKKQSYQLLPFQDEVINTHSHTGGHGRMARAIHACTGHDILCTRVVVASQNFEWQQINGMSGGSLLVCRAGKLFQHSAVTFFGLLLWALHEVAPSNSWQKQAAMGTKQPEQHKQTSRSVDASKVASALAFSFPRSDDCKSKVNTAASAFFSRRHGVGVSRT